MDEGGVWRNTEDGGVGLSHGEAQGVEVEAEGGGVSGQGEGVATNGAAQVGDPPERMIALTAINRDLLD